MSWYDESWKYRRAVKVFNNSGADSLDLQVPMTADDAEFWDNIKPDGADIRVCSADGSTLVTHQLSGFDYAARVVTIEATGLTLVYGHLLVVWIYWGNPDASAPGDSFVPASPVIGSTFYGLPAERKTIARTPRPGDTKPADVFAKAEDEATYIFFDFSQVLIRRATPYGGRELYEEIERFYGVTAYISDGSVIIASMSAIEDCIFLDGAVAGWVEDGTSGETYVLRAKILTTLGRVLEHRALLKVQNLLG